MNMRDMQFKLLVTKKVGGRGTDAEKKEKKGETEVNEVCETKK